MTRQINVGGVLIGGGAPIPIQSMLNTRTTDVEGSLRQIRQLKEAGCQIARLAVPDMDAAKGFAEIASASPLPLVADIHFDYRLAIAAAEGGAAKIRINPGNIGGEERVRAVVDVCKEKRIPIRIGVNGGSLDKKLLEKYGRPTPEAADDAGVSVVPCAVRLSAARGRDRDGDGVYGHNQIGHGHWRTALHGHRRHGSRVADGRPGA